MRPGPPKKDTTPASASMTATITPSGPPFLNTPPSLPFFFLLFVVSSSCGEVLSCHDVDGASSPSRAISLALRSASLLAYALLEVFCEDPEEDELLVELLWLYDGLE